MSDSLPDARSTICPGARERIQRIIAQRGLGGLANDTKWDELISAMRERDGWSPPYRFKCLDGIRSDSPYLDGTPSSWDREWFYHLPFPFLSVEWFDIGRLQRIRIHRLPPQVNVVDHADWIEPLLYGIGLDYRKGVETFRVFGYSPRNLDLFEQSLPDG